MNHNLCDKVRERYSELYEGELPGAVQRETEMHIAACESCSAGFREFSARIDALRTLPRHPVPRAYGQGVLDRIQESTAERRALPRGSWSIGRRFGLQFGWAAALLLAVFVFWRVENLRVEQITNELNSAWRTVALELGQSIEAKHAAETRARTEDSTRIRAELATFAERSLENERELANLTKQLRESPTPRSEANHEDLIATLRSGLEELRATQHAFGAKLEVLKQFETGIAKHEQQLAAFAREADRRWEQLGEQVAELRTLAATRAVATRASDATPPRTRTSEPRVADAPLTIRLGDSGSLRLVADLDDPQAINSLFELYATGDSELKHLALELLDERFRSELAAVPLSDVTAQPKRGGILGVFANDATPTPPVDLAAKRMAAYREFWRAQSYGGGAPPRW
ncbi:MAG: zf-HC2 domain-containing protein [Planctomycetota bacterium]